MWRPGSARFGSARFDDRAACSQVSLTDDSLVLQCVTFKSSGLMETFKHAVLSGLLHRPELRGGNGGRHGLPDVTAAHLQAGRARFGPVELATETHQRSMDRLGSALPMKRAQEISQGKRDDRNELRRVVSHTSV